VERESPGPARRPDEAEHWSARPAALVALIVLLAAGAGAAWLAGGPVGRQIGVRLLGGLVVSLLIGRFARSRGWLTASGALGAALTGTLVVAGGGVTWGALLILFFLSSSLLSRLRRRRAARLAAAPAKGARRDLGQVLANGGAALLLAVAAPIWPMPLLFAAFVGALAAVTADTWSTEIGALSRRPPRLLTSGRVVPAGANGGVTPLGIGASLAGGLMIGAAALLLTPLAAGLDELAVDPEDRGWLPLLGLVAGLGGSLFDSLLGATVQGVRWCPACRIETEATRHECGAATLPRRGWRWLDNDRVNLLASLAGAVGAVAIWRVVAG
jgi:uncharacterized protein (TIGR00297 family)